MNNSVGVNEKGYIYSDIGGTYDCTLVKYHDDKRTIIDEIQLTIIKESLNYSLVIRQWYEKTIVDVSDVDLQLVKMKFNSKFHDLTGNYWKFRHQFIKVPGNYYLLSDEDLSPMTEEKLALLNRIKNYPKFVLNERVFMNDDTMLLKETYPYVYDGSTAEIRLPKVPNKDEVESSLLYIRPIVVRIAVIYEYGSGIQMTFGSGCLISNNLVLTCGHIFDPITWSNKQISYSKILVRNCDPCDAKSFPLWDFNNGVFSAKILQRGLVEENIDEYSKFKETDTDLALLILNNPIEYLKDHYFHPKLVSACSNTLPLNSYLYMIGFSGKLYEQNQMEPYKYLAYFGDLSIHELNVAHHVNYKSISIGNLIQDISQEDPYALHNCSSSSGSNGSIMLDCYGRFIGIHIGVTNSKRQMDNPIYFTEETYNKYISVYSNRFQKFIRQIIVPNINDDQIRSEWLFDFK